MDQEKKRQIAVTALVLGGFINFLKCIGIVPSIVVTITFVCIVIFAFIMITVGVKTRTNLFAKENAILRSAVVFWFVTYLFTLFI